MTLKPNINLSSSSNSCLFLGLSWDYLRNAQTVHKYILNKKILKDSNQNHPANLKTHCKKLKKNNSKRYALIISFQFMQKSTLLDRVNSLYYVHMDILIPQIISNIFSEIKCQTFPTKPFTSPWTNGQME